MLVGEMRDQETVDIAIKAALTGHLVFSTIHTNDAASSITRMENMNIEPFLIADSLILVVAQRLVRRLCKKCAQPHALPEAALLEMGFQKNELKGLQPMKPGGCDSCNKTGYKGRTALFEVMKVDDDIRDHDPDPGPVPGDQAEGHREGHDDPAAERPRQDQERRHLGRRGPARNGPGRMTGPGEKRRFPWLSPSSSC